MAAPTEAELAQISLHEHVTTHQAQLAKLKALQVQADEVTANLATQVKALTDQMAVDEMAAHRDVLAILPAALRVGSLTEVQAIIQRFVHTPLRYRAGVPAGGVPTDTVPAKRRATRAVKTKASTRTSRPTTVASSRPSTPHKLAAKRMTPAQDRSIVAAHKGGLSIMANSLKHGCSRQTIYSALRRAGVKPRGRDAKRGPRGAAAK